MRAPHEALRPHVLALEGYEERLAGPVRQRHLPPTSVPLILNFGPPYLLLDPQDPSGVGASHLSFVSGLGEAGGLTESTGAARCVQVDLTPLGARRILGVPMRELEDRVVRLADVLGPAVGRLEARLDAAADWETRLEIVEAFLLRRLGASTPTRPDVAWAWRRLEETGGRIRIDELARELRCSRKHLLAQFREHVGPGPKTAARLVRFNRLLMLLRREPHAEWSELAFRCGYADQSHLYREVRRLAGCTPPELAAPSPVTFVQDALAAAS